MQIFWIDVKTNMFELINYFEWNNENQSLGILFQESISQ